MDQLNFFKYHNRYISFEYKGERLQGVIVDSIPYDKKKFPTEYVFIQTNNMRAWKNAEKERNEDAMRRFEKKINLEIVKNPQLIYSDETS